jgi:hypothetical protein
LDERKTAVWVESGGYVSGKWLLPAQQTTQDGRKKNRRPG